MNYTELSNRLKTYQCQHDVGARAYIAKNVTENPIWGDLTVLHPRGATGYIRFCNTTEYIEFIPDDQDVDGAGDIFIFRSECNSIHCPALGHYQV